MWHSQQIDDLRHRRASLEGSVALVPTMGALHRGHVSLIERGLEIADHVIVSVFVNPTQFGAGEDFSKYPRPLVDDLGKCEAAGAAGVFCPLPEVMYPPEQIPADVTVPSLATILEGEFRPTHFAGVCRVVLKLFNIVQPDVACFGRKDYQQLKVIEAMVGDLNLPIRIEACETLREPDGLAMSSRNVYLRDAERQHALGMSKALKEAARMFEAGETDPEIVSSAMRQNLEAHQVEVDYAEVRHPTTLQPLDIIEPALTGGVVALVAGRVGNTRLIDNMLLR